MELVVGGGVLRLETIGAFQIHELNPTDRAAETEATSLLMQHAKVTN
jgi:hypothetical protein